MSKFIHGPAVAGQSVVDRVLAAKHTVAGQSLAKVICKATTEEVMGPKRKHLDYLLQCTDEANVSVPEMANLLIERTQNANWVVVFKALITVHNLMNYGNERFTQYLASNNCTFNLSNFTDRSGTQGYDMSTYIRRYAKYLNEKAVSYRVMAFDFCKVKRGKEDGILRTMNTERLLKTLPILQSLLDALVEFDVSANELTNGVINAAFMLLFKDLIRLFACYNDGIINLLEKYFEMNKKNCREALDVYKKFLLRMDRVCEFLKVAENVGIDKGDIPDLAKAPSSLLEALEQHLISLENSKKASAVPSKPNSGVSVVISNYASASLLAAAPGADAGVTHISDDERRCILEEEQRQLDQMKKKKLQEVKSSSPSSIPLSSGLGIGAPVSSSSVHVAEKNVVSVVDSFHQPSTGSDLIAAELLHLTNPRVTSSQQPESLTFDEPFMNSHCASSFDSCPTASAANPFGVTSQPAIVAAAPWSNQLQTCSQGFDTFNQILQPSVPPITGTHSTSPSSAPTASQSTASSEKLIKADLDSSLASLAGNLHIRTSPQVKKLDHQWFNTTEKCITGSRNTWSQSVASPSHPNQVVGANVGNGLPQFIQPTMHASYYQSTVSQFPPMVVGQMSSFGWVSAQPNACTMSSATFLQPHVHPNAHPTVPDDPFGSL